MLINSLGWIEDEAIQGMLNLVHSGRELSSMEPVGGGGGGGRGGGPNCTDLFNILYRKCIKCAPSLRP